MCPKIYIGNLNNSTTEQDLEDSFKTYGHVISSLIMINHLTGRSRGFGFIEMSSQQDATQAITALDGSDLHGQEIIVNEVKPKQERKKSYFG